MALTVLLLAGAGVLQLVGWSRPAPTTLRTPPFTLEHPGLPADSAYLVLYVSTSCPWCAVELAAWADEEASGHRGAPLWLALAPGSRPGSSVIPDGLRHRALFDDADGSLGRGLGVGAVPFLAAVGPGRRIMEVSTGLTSPDDRSRLLALLRSAPPFQEDLP